MFKYSKKCFLHSEYFRHSQHSLSRSGRDRYCAWVEDSCTGGKCNYAVCIKRRLLTDGMYSMTIRGKSKEETFPETIEEPNFRIRVKTLRRLGKEELF